MIDEQGLYDIYGLVHVPFWQTKLFMGGVSILGILLLISFLILLKKGRVRFQRPYWEEVISELKGLQADPFCIQDPKRVYSDLTTIIKRYISIRYNTSFVGRTDEEIVQLLKRHQLFSADVPNIRPLFEGVSTIKFARKYYSTRKIERDINLSLVFVQRTIPKES